VFRLKVRCPNPSSAGRHHADLPQGTRDLIEKRRTAVGPRCQKLFQFSALHSRSPYWSFSRIGQAFRLWKGTTGPLATKSNTFWGFFPFFGALFHVRHPPPPQQRAQRPCGRCPLLVGCPVQTGLGERPSPAIRRPAGEPASACSNSQVRVLFDARQQPRRLLSALPWAPRQGLLRAPPWQLFRPQQPLAHVGPQGSPPPYHRRHRRRGVAAAVGKAVRPRPSLFPPLHGARQQTRRIRSRPGMSRPARRSGEPREKVVWRCRATTPGCG